MTVARLQSFGDVTKKGSMPTSDKEFISRVGIDGRFSYVDPRCVPVRVEGGREHICACVRTYLCKC